MATKRGTLNHAKGHVINKLFKQKQFGGSHVPLMFMTQGYPPKWRHLIGKAIQELSSEGIIIVETKRTGRDSGDHAVLASDGLAKSRALLNAYRRCEGLPTLGKDLKTLLPI